MSAAELVIKDSPIKIKFSESSIKGCIMIKTTSADKTLSVAVIDRAQAHFLMLYLQEHLDNATQAPSS